MSISKGLILYKASRYHEAFPVNLKYGYYSDKILVSKSATKIKKRDFPRNSRQKLVKELSLILICNVDTNFQALRLLSRFSRIKKCLIGPRIYAKSENEKNSLGTKTFQCLFKALKRIKHLEVQDTGFNFADVQKNSKTERAFLLLTCLESLTFQWLGYSQKTKSLEHLLNIVSKLKNRPKFKSLRVNSFEPNCYSWRREEAFALESLQNLLKFLQDCGDFSKCLEIGQLALPHFFYLNFEPTVAILNEISKIVPFIKSIDIGEIKYFSEILEIFQHSTSLKKVSLEIKENDQMQEKAVLSVLNRMVALQEFNLHAENTVRADLTLHSQILAQIQTMTNLTAFSLDIGGGTILTEELKTDLARVILNLTELKSLKLKFWNRYGNTDFLAFKNLCLGDIFEAIGQRNKLEILSITICTFSNDNFVALHRSLKKLEQLSDLHLAEIRCENIKEKEIGEFWNNLSKLPKLQKLSVMMTKSSGFQSETFENLLSMVRNNYPILSSFSLNFQKVEITSQSYQLLSEIIHKRRSLNWMSLRLEGKGIDLNFLEKKLDRRMSGRIYHSGSL